MKSIGKVSGCALGVGGGFGVGAFAESFLGRVLLWVSFGGERGPGLSLVGASEKQIADAAFTSRARTRESLSVIV